MEDGQIIELFFARDEAGARGPAAPAMRRISAPPWPGTTSPASERSTPRSARPTPTMAAWRAHPAGAAALAPRLAGAAPRATAALNALGARTTATKARRGREPRQCSTSWPSASPRPAPWAAALDSRGALAAASRRLPQSAGREGAPRSSSSAASSASRRTRDRPPQLAERAGRALPAAPNAPETARLYLEKEELL